MKALTLVAVISLSALALASARAGSAETRGQRAPGSGEPKVKPPSTAAAPVYTPPRLGAPGGRIGGGTRSAGRDLFVLSVLAPDHTGLTLQEQPSLYWYISTATSLPMELTVTDPGTTHPLIEVRLPSPVTAGVHRVRLADHGVRLAPGVPYRWFVAVVPDPARRSRDVLAGGTIERIEPPEAVRTKLTRARPDELPFVYAQAGLWYDALAAVSELIERAPQDQELRGQRAELLTQVGLPRIEAEP